MLVKSIIRQYGIRNQTSSKIEKITHIASVLFYTVVYHDDGWGGFHEEHYS